MLIDRVPEVRPVCGGTGPLSGVGQLCGCPLRPKLVPGDRRIAGGNMV